MRKTLLSAFFAAVVFLPLRVAEQDPNRQAVIARAQEFNRAGEQAITKGDLPHGKQCYTEAIRLLQNIPNCPEMAKAYRGLGKIAFYWGDFPQAENAWLKDISIRAAIDPRSYELSKTYTNLGALAEAQTDLTKATSYLERALAIQQAAHQPQDYAITLNNLAIVNLECADYQKANQIIAKALDLHRRYLPESIYLADALDTAARIKRAGGQLQEAQRLYDEAEQLIFKVGPHTTTAADVEEGLSEVLTDTHHMQEAKQHAEAALHLRELIAPRSDRKALVLGTLGRIARTQHYDVTARNYYERAMALLAEDVSLLNLGISESQVRGQYSDLYAAYIDFLVTGQNDVCHALEVSEQLQARAFLEMLENARINVRGDDPTQRAKRQNLLSTLNILSGQRRRLIDDPHAQGALTELNLRIDSTFAELRNLDNDIAQTHPQTREVIRAPMLSSSDMTALLDNDTVMLEFVLANPRSFVFAVDSARVRVYQLPARERINQVVTELYRLWRDSPDDLLPQAGRKATANAVTGSKQLAEMILGPLWPTIKTKHQIVIVANGVLNYVPFGALPVPPQNTFLITEHEVVNVPSASVLSSIRHRPRPEKASKPAIVFADPVFVDSDSRVKNTAKGTADHHTLRENHWSRLPYSQLEANYISALFPGTIEKLGFAASRQEALSAELAQYRIVHFASHGVIDNLNPGLSALVLSQVDDNGKPQLGYLTLQDFYHLHLRADLVVLGACKTALGGDLQGEGIIGLTRGCMFSGARQVISSLWEVSDAATTELMKNFYAALQHGMAPQTALRQAQLEMAQKPGWEHPHFWAGFVIQGDWMQSH